ncbi:LysR family transcriptional regulator [Herbaspirillum seropedicae]|uniref:Transcription regulator protein n=1 Tax=Herbaspirillum seropedicae (strain SmR1) TaxID=757424 RepID=D8IPS2_HERSS|nr:LysR family transcriptional regulator [Herbaspirillum seropedicae]ADJ64969.1 transcription regulator protein [Herbaspirillum seropedicae SmR1]AKN66850.1 LysR family transcriptional regulator [Herbaspirillum seropedicae]NQE28134.1 LysR family transcriptional regulator [Herbaspirillum seropedicae]UMU22847.1 LysR family transcriptional regulator [Herbaspirillum seropedicae]
MADIEPNWEWYRSFLKVLETGSLSAAGREMGLTQPTVGRHIENLESTLGLKLFVRSFDGFSPTDAALELKPYAAAIAANSAALRRAASSQGKEVRGTVRLTASEVISVEVLPPILAALRHRHPELRVELVLSNKADDLLQREADIAVRMFRPAQDALVAKRLGSIELGLHAHQSYLTVHGAPKSVDALADHTLIGFDQESAYVRNVLKQIPWLSRAALALRTDSDLAQLAAIRAGFGIGICQVALAARDVALVRLLPRQFALKMETWVAMHEDLRASPRCAVTFAALVAGLGAYIRS